MTAPWSVKIRQHLGGRYAHLVGPMGAGVQRPAEGYAKGGFDARASISFWDLAALLNYAYQRGAREAGRTAKGTK